MRSVWLITGKDLKVQLRRGSVLILGFVAPLSLAFIMNLVFGGMNDPDAPFTFQIGIAQQDDGDSGQGFQALANEIADSGFVELTSYPDETAARDGVDNGTVEAAWIIPPNFSAAVESGADSTIMVVADVDSPTTASVAEAIARRYATTIGTSTLAGMVAAQTGVASLDQIGTIAQRVATAPPLIRLDQSAPAPSALDPTTSLTAGLALFFVFFTAGLPLLSIIEERDGGTLARLLVAPIPTASIRAGKTLASVLLGVMALACLMLASTVLMGANWGSPWGALVVATAAVTAVSGIMSVAGARARTTEQAGNLQGIVAIVLGILGGAFVPLSRSGSGLLTSLQRLTPNGQFLDAIEQLRAHGLSAALPSVAVLLGMGAVTGMLGLWLSRSALRR